MTDHSDTVIATLRQRLSDVEGTLDALLSGEIDAAIDPRDNSPVLLAIAQKRLRESEERYRSIVETASEGIWLLSLDGTITCANDRMARMLGCSVSEIVGRSFYDFVPARQRELAVQRLARAPSGLSEESEAELLLPTGRELVVVVKSSIICDASGECASVLIMITDATRRSEAERALRESEAEYRQIVESTTDGVVKLDPSGTIVFVNARFSEMLGYESQELIGEHVLSMVMPSERDAVREALQRRMHGAFAPTDTICQHKSGQRIFVNVASAALRDLQGLFIGTLGVVRDTTERRRLQSDLMVSDRMASVGTLAAGVAHEINNPLAAAMANLEFLHDGVKDLQALGDLAQRQDWVREQFAEPLADARDATERVRRIVKDLMIFSRSPIAEHGASVDVNTVLESSLRMARNEIRHRAELVLNLGQLPAVVADEARLGQVFLNLIVNAAQALPVGRAAEHQIRVTSRRDADTVVVEVGDTGTGIAAHDISRIFDAFYTTKDVGQGTGLGLAICQRIVSDFGGSLTVCSEVGVGSTFSVTLRVAEGVERAVTRAAPHLAASYTGRVLVIDDEDLVARSVQRSLGASCNLVRCTSASAALTLIEEGEFFDVVLCDIMMPNMTGMDLYNRLLEVAPAQARRMMFMTGGVFTEEAKRFTERSDIVVLEKPFSVAELRETVKRFSGSREQLTA